MAKEIRIPSAYVIETHIAGVSFKNDDGSDRQTIIKSFLKEGMALDLAAESDNKYDPNAVKILVSGNQIGHIPRDHSHMVRHAIDAGTSIRANVDWIGEKEIVGVGIRIEMSN